MNLVLTIHESDLVALARAAENSRMELAAWAKLALHKEAVRQIEENRLFQLERIKFKNEKI